MHCSVNIKVEFVTINLNVVVNHETNDLNEIWNVQYMVYVKLVIVEIYPNLNITNLKDNINNTNQRTINSLRCSIDDIFTFFITVDIEFLSTYLV